MFEEWHITENRAGAKGMEVANRLSSQVFGQPEKATRLGTVERSSVTSDRPRRVYDSVYAPPDPVAWREIAYPAPRVNAQHRIFVAENGERRLFAFTARFAPPGAEQLALDPQTVTDQFDWAGHAASVREEYEDPRRDRSVLRDPKWMPPEQHALRVHTSNIKSVDGVLRRLIAQTTTARHSVVMPFEWGTRFGDLYTSRGTGRQRKSAYWSLLGRPRLRGSLLILTSEVERRFCCASQASTSTLR